MGIDETTLIFRNPTITWNYQTFHTGCFLVNDGEFFQADTFYSVSESLFCIGTQLLESSTRFDKTNQRVFYSAEKIFVQIKCAWLAYFVKKGDMFILNYMEK